MKIPLFRAGTAFLTSVCSVFIIHNCIENIKLEIKIEKTIVLQNKKIYTIIRNKKKVLNLRLNIRI